MGFTPTAKSIINQIEAEGATFTELVGFTQPNILAGGIVARIYPRDPDSGYAANLPFNFTANQTDNSPNLTRNFIVGIGHNQDGGGGRESTDDASLGLLFEQRFDSGLTGGGGYEYMEYHVAYTARDTANNVSAGTQLRLKSYTINKATNGVDNYETSSNYYIKNINASYFQSEYGSELEAIWWSMQPGQWVMRNGVHGTEASTLTCTLSYDSGISKERATFTGEAIRLDASYAVEIVGAACQIGTNTVAFSGSGDATFESNVRIIVQNSTNLALYLSGGGSGYCGGMWRTATGLQAYSTTKPSGDNDACILYGKAVSSVSHPHFCVGNTEYKASMQVAAPSTASSTGLAGTFAYDSSYFYVCTATDTWKRVALSTW